MRQDKAAQHKENIDRQIPITAWVIVEAEEVAAKMEQDHQQRSNPTQRVKAGVGAGLHLVRGDVSCTNRSLADVHSRTLPNTRIKVSTICPVWTLAKLAPWTEPKSIRKDRQFMRFQISAPWRCVVRGPRDGCARAYAYPKPSPARVNATFESELQRPQWA